MKSPCDATQLDVCSKSADNSRRRRNSAWWRRLWWPPVLVGAGGVSLAVVGIILGSYGLVNLGALPFALAGGGLISGCLVLVVAALRRSRLCRGRLVGRLAATLCCGGLIAAVYVFGWQPWRALRSLEFLQTATPAEMRSVCHRSLLWHPGPHDQFISLTRAGDESSVPYIIWAMRFMPAQGFRRCTWSHGIEALETITNNSVGTTRKAWAQWYEANKHRPRIAWWADGFTAQGYAVSAAGGEESIRNLLRVLGRAPWCQREQRMWLSLNAKRMLRLLDAGRVRAVMDQVRSRGTVQQRRGLAHYAGELPHAESEPILLALLTDKDRSVRLCASGVLCHRQLEWLKNPGRFVLKRYEPGQVDPDDFFAPAGKDVVAAKMGTQRRYWAGDAAEWETKVVPGAAGPAECERPACIIRIDYQGTGFYRPAVLSLEGRSPSSGRSVYSRQLITTTAHRMDELRWLYDGDTDRLYVSAPGFTCLADPKTGDVVWEIGFGTGNCDDLLLLRDYLVIRTGSFTVCDAARGGILANYDLQDELFDDRLSLVDGQLRAKGFDDRLYVIELPQLRRPAGN